MILIDNDFFIAFLRFYIDFAVCLDPPLSGTYWADLETDLDMQQNLWRGVVL